MALRKTTVMVDADDLAAIKAAAEREGRPESEYFREVSPLVFAEIEHVMTRLVDRAAAHAVQDWLLVQTRSWRVLIPELSEEVLRTARRVQTRYAALRLDLADAVNVAVAERYETDTVLTLDRRDFRAVQPLTGSVAFRLLPDDS